MVGAETVIRIVELASIRLCDAEIPGPSRSPGRALRRAAWAPTDASPHGNAVSVNALQRLAGGLPAGIALDAAGLLPPAVFPAQIARVLLNLLLLAADSLPDGGVIELAGPAEDMFIRIAGPRAAWPSNFGALLHDETAALAAVPTEAGLQPALTVLLARQAGLRLSMVIPPTRQPVPPLLRLSA